jgi:serine phosphatase RsbU (regulator of sigma subunit)
MLRLWNNISLIGKDTLRNPDDIRQLSLLNRIATIGAIVLFSFIPIALYLNVPVMVVSVSLGASLSLLSLGLNHQGLFHFSRPYFLSITIVFVTLILLISGKDAGSQITFILIGILHLILYRNTLHSVIYMLLVMAVFLGSSWYVETFGSPLDFMDDKIKRFSFYLNVGSNIFLIFCVVLYFKNTTEEHEKVIISKNEEIAQKNKDITDSIHYAQRIQNAILPRDKVLREMLPEHFVLYRPKDIVAGDFYWAQRSGPHVFFAAADCTGHGVPGALVSVVCHDALNRSIFEFGLSDPAEIMNKTRSLVIELFGNSEENIRDGMDISLCSMDTATGNLRWAGANNPLWIFRGNELIECKPDKQHIGLSEQMKPFTSTLPGVRKNDMLYLFTDGFYDQFGGSEGKKFKRSKLKDTLLKIHSLSIQEQKKMLEKSFMDWKGNLEQVDDVLIIGVRV